MKFNNQIQAFIFDMDGVLFATQAANDEAYRRSLADHKIIVSSDFYKRLYGNKFEKVILQDHPNLDNNFIQQIKKSKHQHYSTLLSHIKENHALLDLIRFSRHHLPIGLATSAARANALLILNHFDALALFDATIFFEDVTEPKPDPQCYHLCAQRLNVPIENCMIWEDSQEGLEAARLSGARYTKVIF